jgi:hypothetical protein
MLIEKRSAAITNGAVSYITSLPDNVYGRHQTVLIGRWGSQ